MPQVLMHMFEMRTIPSIFESPFYKPFKFLEDDSLIVNCIEKSDKLPFIRDWGLIRSKGKAGIYEHRLWRNISSLHRTNQLDRNALHLIPFYITPTFKIIAEQPYLKILRFFIYLTPHSVSSHLVVSIDCDRTSLKNLRFYEDYYCITSKKGNISERKQFFDLLAWANEKILNSMIDRHSPSDLKVYSLSNLYRITKIVRNWLSPSAIVGMLGTEPERFSMGSSRKLQHTSYGLMTDQPAPENAQQFFDANHLGKDAKLLVHDDNRDWKIISRRRSVISLHPGTVYWKGHEELRARQTRCHFNNWNDLLFLYHLIYSNIEESRGLLIHENNLSEKAYHRLTACYEAYNKLSTESGWRVAIQKLVESHTITPRIPILYDDIRHYWEGKSVPSTHVLLKIAMFVALVAGIAIVISGVVFIYLGATGDTEVVLFGQTLKSQNVGVSAVFIGAVLIRSIIIRVLDIIGGKTR